MRLPVTIDMDPPAILRALATQLEAAPAPAQLAPASGSIPAFGTFLEDQGGTLVGIYLDDTGRLCGLVTPVDENGDLGDMEWGCRGKEIKGASSLTDGLANTNAMADAGSKMAKKARAVKLGGKDDWCIPAQKQLMACYLFHPAPFAKVWHWSSTQYSAYNAWVQDFAAATPASTTSTMSSGAVSSAAFPFNPSSPSTLQG